jgi:acetyl esterase/lipase
MKPLIFSLCITFVFGLNAQTNVWQPSPGHTQVPIWPGAVPDARPVVKPESMRTTPPPGKPVVFVNNVSQPTMTVYSPKRKNNSVAIVVFPGGGYYELAIDLEGTEICDWLNSKGITAVLLKYRVPSRDTNNLYWESPRALEDAQRTLSLARYHAAELHINPHKIGVIGFSAGGHLVTATSTHFDKRSYAPVDGADNESCRPDFGIALYPGHLWTDENGLTLNPNVPVTSNTPPQFICQAENDPVDNVRNSLVYFLALKEAKVPAELHLYAEGGHGFGLRRANMPIGAWPQLAEKWLGTIGMTKE